MFTVHTKVLRAFAQTLIGVGLVGSFVVGCQDTGGTPSPVASANVQEGSAVAKNGALPPKHWETLTFAADKQAVNKDLIALAKAVAVTMNDNETRTALHKAALQRFDGDTEVLWTDLNSNQALTNRASQSNARDWTALVAQKADKSVFSSPDAITAAVRRTAKEYNANVHLFWFNAEKWDKTTAPIVAFVPVGCDPEKENIILSGYDARGNKYAVDKEFALKNPVVVINANERTNADGTVKEGYLPGSQNAVKRFSKDGAALQSTTYLELVSTQWTNNYAEGWFNGNPEFWAFIFSVDAQNPSPTGSEWGRWDCTVDWWRCNGEVIPWPAPWQRGANWNTAQYKTLAFQWIEKDTGNSYTHSITSTFNTDNGSTVSTSTISGTDQDDKLGLAQVNHNDPSKVYNTGAPNFVLAW